MSDTLTLAPGEACDDQVMSGGVDGAEYAAHLFALLTQARACQPDDRVEPPGRLVVSRWQLVVGQFGRQSILPPWTRPPP
jgi:hypothetical protein